MADAHTRDRPSVVAQALPFSVSSIVSLRSMHFDLLFNLDKDEARARRVEVDRDEAPAPAPRAPAAKSAEREFPDVAAWQPLVMNTAQECAGCGRQMRRGDDAYLAVGGTRPGPLFLCQPCLQDL